MGGGCEYGKSVSKVTRCRLRKCLSGRRISRSFPLGSSLSKTIFSILMKVTGGFSISPPFF